MAKLPKTAEELEEHIKSELPKLRYMELYEQIARLELDNQWLETDAGKEEAGRDNAIERMAQNDLSITKLKKALAFIKTLL